MNMLHNIQKGKVVGGTTKKSWLKLEFKADSLDFRELSRIHDAFPRLFEPAFSLQQNLMVRFFFFFFLVFTISFVFR
jgi:hypothetical protein